MRLLFIMLALALTFSSCRFLGGERISGNGHVSSREENVGSFNSLDVSGAVDVHVKQDQSQSVRIETDENLMEYLEVFTEGSTLVIRTKRGFNLDPSRGLTVYVSAPAYKHMEVSGASKITGDNALSVDELTVSASGASKITLEVNGRKLTGDASGASTLDLKGEVGNLDIEASGASHLKAFDLTAGDAIIDVSGASGASVTANKTLKAEASGASHINYKGNASVSPDVSGASSIKKED
jgi:carbon monoxide dehydrogenase subunit G